MSENNNTNESIINKVETIEKPQPIQGSAGFGGYATWTLRNAETGEIKQEGTTKNMILGRGLDWIISHIITGSFPSGTTSDGGSSNYHATGYLSSGADIAANPFKYLLLMKVNDPTGANSVQFDEGITTSLYYIHKCTAGDGVVGTDVQSFNGRIGDSNTNVLGSHNFGASAEASTRTKILGWKTVGTFPNYTSSDIGVGSAQSNFDPTTPKFQRVSLVFNFGTSEANCNGSDTINCIGWADSPEAKCCGARLIVSPGIPKTNADTLDITYTFDLTITVT